MSNTALHVFLFILFFFPESHYRDIPDSHNITPGRHCQSSSGQSVRTLWHVRLEGAPWPGLKYSQQQPQRFLKPFLPSTQNFAVLREKRKLAWRRQCKRKHWQALRCIACGPIKCLRYRRFWFVPCCRLAGSWRASGGAAIGTPRLSAPRM